MAVHMSGLQLIGRFRRPSIHWNADDALRLQAASPGYNTVSGTRYTRIRTHLQNPLGSGTESYSPNSRPVSDSRVARPRSVPTSSPTRRPHYTYNQQDGEAYLLS